MMKNSIFVTSTVGVLTMVLFIAQYYYNFANAQEENTELSNLQNTHYAEFEAETEQLRRQLAQTRIQVTELKNQLSGSTSNRATVSNTENDLVPEQRLEQSKSQTNLEEQPERQSPEPQNVKIFDVYEVESALTEFESNFWLDPQDFQWTEEVSKNLQKLLEKRRIPDTTLGQIECHSSICQAEFVHKEDHGHDVLLQQFGSMALLSGGYLVKTDEYSSASRTLIYFPREGATLPLPMNLLSNGDTL